MESSLSTLSLLAELTTAFVAFSAIVASLRVTFGARLTPFQILLVQFFTVAGMLTVSVEVLPLILAGFIKEELVVARYSTYYTVVVCGGYLVIYLRQRFSISAPTPIPSIIVMAGYAIWLPLLTVISLGLYSQPSLAIISAVGFWGLFSSVIIFVVFLSEFIDPIK